MTTTQSTIVMKSDEHKIHKISDKLVLAIFRESGNTIQFSEYIGKNIQLMRNDYELSPKAAACFTRRNLTADYLRNNSVKVPYATHGYGGMFSTSVLDRYHKYDCIEEEAYALLKKYAFETFRSD
ncbi:proteasome subunit beta type-2-like [Temnothorax longispinosus]|uniref:proteasome subunit beta type-2-like n=1 Tax=Temnothorax longispinosus TaxID=300112 RepID=UPI003A9954CE